MVELTKETFLELLALNIEVLKYLPQGLGLATAEVEEVLSKVVAEKEPREEYIRALVGSRELEPGGAFPLDKMALIYNYGSPQAKRIAVDEKLKF